jgi:hypothetical protein
VHAHAQLGPREAIALAYGAGLRAGDRGLDGRACPYDADQPCEVLLVHSYMRGLTRGQERSGNAVDPDRVVTDPELDELDS